MNEIRYDFKLSFINGEGIQDYLLENKTPKEMLRFIKMNYANYPAYIIQRIDRQRVKITENI